MVSRRSPGALVLGGDSVLALGVNCHQMPRPGGLRALLRKLSGKTHRCFRGGPGAGRGVSGGIPAWRADHARLSEAFLDAYLAAEGEALLSVGGRLSF